MKRTTRAVPLLALALVLAAVAASSAPARPSASATTAASPASAFALLGRYATGLDGNSAEVVAVDGDRMVVANADDRSLDIVDIGGDRLRAPQLLERVDLSAYGDAVTSVDARFGLVAAAVPAEEAGEPGTVVVLDRRGNVLAEAEVGFGPDMLTFALGAGTLRILVANEGEPTSYGEPDSIDPVGSISVIDVVPVGGKLRLRVRTAGFERFDGQEAALRARGVRIFGPGASASQDLEPEYVSVDPLGLKAYATLQENNAIAVVDLLGTPRVESILPLGTKDHGLPGHGLDASDRDSRANIETWPVRGMFQPDAIATFRAGLGLYHVTANEGDARDYDGFSEEARAGAAADKALIPAAGDNAKLGRLTVTTAFPASGATGQTQLHAFGGRSFSIWNARTGELVWDSGDALERLTAHVLPDDFNGDGVGGTFDTRSDNKGPEPEAVAVGRVGGRTYAFVGLERVGGVVVADVTDPHAPRITQYLTGNWPAGPDRGPEVIEFVSALESPSRTAFIAVANEVSGTVSLWGAVPADGAGTLTLLHNNDGESSLLPLTNTVTVNGTPDKLPVGGAAAFKAVTDREISAARTAGRSVLDVYAGDAFLASATLTCSIEDTSIDVYDAVAQRQIPYDAHVLGNHEFDYTPDFLERFIRSFETGGVLDQPFLSANLDVSGEPGLAALADPGGLIVGQTANGKVIARSAIVVDATTTQRFGVVGATTPLLPTISSPRNVVVTTTDNASTAAVVQAEVDRLTSLGVNKIVVVSHLQDATNDKALIALTRNVDIAVAGGGDELLFNDPADLLPGDNAANKKGDYPILQKDADGKDVPIVTTSGNYRYLGRLVASFDANGVLTAVDASSKPVRVVPKGSVASALGVADAVDKDAGVVSTVDTPVSDCLADLAATPVATSEVLFDVSNAGVRSKQSNGGNLVADAWLAAYDRYAATSGLPARSAANPVVAIQNGGGIRQNAGDQLPVGGAPGTISRLNVIDVLPFDNTLVVVEAMTPADVKAMLEKSAERLPSAFGGFLQIGGFDVTYRAANPAGSRVVEVTLDDGTPVVSGGAVAPGAPASIRVVTNNFTANGGDGYTVLAGKTKTTLRTGDGLAIPYELGLREYLQSFPVGASGLPTVPASDTRYTPYPAGETRITFAP